MTTASGAASRLAFHWQILEPALRRAYRNHRHAFENRVGGSNGLPWLASPIVRTALIAAGCVKSQSPEQFQPCFTPLWFMNVVLRPHLDHTHQPALGMVQ